MSNNEEEIIHEPMNKHERMKLLSYKEKSRYRLFVYLGAVILIALAAIYAIAYSAFASDSTNESIAQPAPSPIGINPPPDGSWYFAVSGDSRDCGDLIMPKIAATIESNRSQAPVELYWHLGDYRAIYRVDCDMAKRTDRNFNCAPDARKDVDAEWANVWTPTGRRNYLNAAWSDFIKYQLEPFKTPVYLGIGNHELISSQITPTEKFALTPGMFQATFKKWLTQASLEAQRSVDEKNGIPSTTGKAYYHFIQKGVDFISLDNADKQSQFTADQIIWLTRVLKEDARNDSVKTIIVGMHAALPRSKASDHGMDASCQGVCSGLQVYDLLYRAQNLNGPPEKRKHVYVMSSHSHYFEKDIFDTPDHQGQVLKGWIIGTAGAEQYRDKIMYGYLQVAVHPDGTISTDFKQVDRDTPAAIAVPEADVLTSFCFEQNKKVRKPEESDAFTGDCACGELKSVSNK